MYAASGGTTDNAMAATLAPAGGGQPHNNMHPFLTLNFIIAIQGIFPSRG
jgi:microcystin-dependent protein